MVMADRSGRRSDLPQPKTGGEIPWAHPAFWGNEEPFLLQAFRSTWISGGEFVDRFEREVAALVGTKFAITASNGTTAIHMAYLGLDLQPGDEIIVPGFGFLAAANVAIHMHLRPVFADVDPHTWCLSADSVERLITAKTRLIVPVHTYGNVCAMDAILDVGRRTGVAVMEDAAESFASQYKGRYSGAIAPIGTLSFQATKTVTTGEGGMVLTNDDAIHQTMVLYRNHGMSKRRYWHELAGHNFRLTNLQAAIGCAQLEALDRIATERRRVHASYRAGLQNVAGVTLQAFSADVDPVLWAMAVELDPEAFPQGRDELSAQMAGAGIETRPGFYAASVIPLYECPPLPVAEKLSANVVSLPTYPTLDDDQIDRICRQLRDLRR